MAAITADQLTRYDALELGRLNGTGDPWKSAWEAVDLAREIRRSGISGLNAPSAEAVGLAWELVKIAESCDRRLAAEGRTSADDNGDTASHHARKCLDTLAGRAIHLAFPGESAR